MIMDEYLLFFSNQSAWKVIYSLFGFILIYHQHQKSKLVTLYYLALEVKHLFIRPANSFFRIIGPSHLQMINIKNVHISWIFLPCSQSGKHTEIMNSAQYLIKLFFLTVHVSIIIWLTDFACCDWSIPGLLVAVRTSSSQSPFQTRNNQQSHIINILLALFARSVWQVMDPCFFLPCFHGPRASHLGHKRKEKTRSITYRTDLALG